MVAVFFVFVQVFYCINPGNCGLGLMAFITTILAILTFYISYYLITPVTGKNKVIVFIIVAIVFVVGISFLGTVLELAVYRVFSGNSKHWYFMSRLWSSAFFTGFVFVVATALRLKEQLPGTGKDGCYNQRKTVRRTGLFKTRSTHIFYSMFTIQFIF